MECTDIYVHKTGGWWLVITSPVIRDMYALAEGAVLQQIHEIFPVSSSLQLSGHHERRVVQVKNRFFTLVTRHSFHFSYPDFNSPYSLGARKSEPSHGSKTQVKFTLTTRRSSHFAYPAVAKWNFYFHFWYPDLIFTLLTRRSATPVVSLFLPGVQFSPSLSDA